MRTLLVALCVIPLVACNALRPHLDDKKIEASIRSEFKSQGVDIKNIDCPENRPLKEGDEFECKVKDDDGDDLTIKVEQTDAHGSIKWKLDGKILDMDKVGDMLEPKVGSDVDVQCPSKKIVLIEGKKFSCKYSKNGAKGKVQFTTVDNDGNVKWKLIES